jgi:uncharacterized membrane protein YhaH (DUF805 family)
MSESSPARRIMGPLGRLLDFSGRSAPGDFWPYMLLLVAIYVIGFALVFTLQSHDIGSPVADIFVLIPTLILLAFAAVVRRLHDVGWSGRWMAAYVILALAFFAFLFYQRYQLSHGLYDPSDDALFRFFPIMALLALVTNCIALTVFIVCLLPGTAGPNKYGPDPKGGSTP